MTPERKKDDLIVIPLDFLDEAVPDFATSEMDEIREWFGDLVEEGIISQEIMDERIEQIEESRGITSEDNA